MQRNNGGGVSIPAESGVTSHATGLQPGRHAVQSPFPLNQGSLRTRGGNRRVRHQSPFPLNQGSLRTEVAKAKFEMDGVSIPAESGVTSHKVTGYVLSGGRSPFPLNQGSLRTVSGQRDDLSRLHSR